MASVRIILQEKEEGAEQTRARALGASAMAVGAGGGGRRGGALSCWDICASLLALLSFVPYHRFSQWRIVCALRTACLLHSEGAFACT